MPATINGRVGPPDLYPRAAGGIIIRQPGGVAGTDEVQVYSSASISYLNSPANALILRGGNQALGAAFTQIGIGTVNDGGVNSILIGSSAANLIRITGDTGDIKPVTTNSADLGAAATAWADVFLMGSLYKYQSYTDASNYELFQIATAAGSVTLSAQTLGSGTDNISILSVPAGTGSIVAKAAGAAASDLYQWQNSSGTPMSSVGVAGSLCVGASLATEGLSTIGNRIFLYGGASAMIAQILSDGLEMRSGMQVGWSSSATQADAAKDTGLARAAAGVLRVSNYSTGSGNLLLGTSTVGSIGTNGVSVIGLANGTAPTTSPADTVQLYAADSAAGNSNLFIRNEAGAAAVQMTGLKVRMASAVTNVTTTFANLSDLTLQLRAGAKYTGTLVLPINEGLAADGFKLDLNGGTATMTSVQFGFDSALGATIGTRTSTALATAITLTALTDTSDMFVTVQITVVVNAAGTFIPRQAKNTDATGGTLTLRTGGYLWLEETPA